MRRTKPVMVKVKMETSRGPKKIQKPYQRSTANIKSVALKIMVVS
jgi:hypothetical protein